MNFLNLGMNDQNIEQNKHLYKDLFNQQEWVETLRRHFNRLELQDKINLHEKASADLKKSINRKEREDLSEQALKAAVLPLKTKQWKHMINISLLKDLGKSFENLILKEDR
jgi:hypothetical protein